MSILRLINEAPLLPLVLGTILLFEIYTIGLILIFRRIWGHERLQRNNEVGGFKFANIGVLYAVMLAFMVIAVWQDYQDVETAVRTEAKAVRDLHHLTYALPGNAGEAVRKPLLAYAKHVKKDEWPEMADGTLGQKPAEYLAHVAEAILSLKVETLKDLAQYQEALRLAAVIQDSRSERVESADGSIPQILWLALIGGAFILLGYPAFFGTQNVIAQVSMAAVMAALVALVLLPAILLDFPFTGPVHISSEPFDIVTRELPPNGIGDKPAAP
ncbi:bestrophin-like domain [Methyloligella solikamskensis]|uniref:DUF4239 domain-containing protein n=1 Tax=Methyloligella solikamskensis TaxID=1177756 RepID=A0ABW3JBT1_9HYPH